MTSAERILQSAIEAERDGLWLYAEELLECAVITEKRWQDPAYDPWRPDRSQPSNNFSYRQLHQLPPGASWVRR